MKSGIELIAEERQEQIEKHGRTIEKDVAENFGCKLSYAAQNLLSAPVKEEGFPIEWNKTICAKMAVKSYKERLIIAGALIAAEIDRLNALNP
jgi:hypothetical protein